MCAGILRSHGLQRAGFPARGGPGGARARLLGRGCGCAPSAAAEGREAAISGGRRRRQHGAQHAPRCDADARYLLVDAVPVFRDADARPCENRPARYGSADEGDQPLGGQPCPAQRSGLRPCAGTAQGRGHSSSRLRQRVAAAFGQRHHEAAGREAPAAPARCEAARGMGSRWCEGRVQHSRLDAGLFDRHSAGWFIRGGCCVLLQICSESCGKNRRKVVLPGRKIGKTVRDLRGRRRPRGHGRGRCTHVHGMRTYVRNGARQRAADLCRKIWGGEFTIFGL